MAVLTRRTWERHSNPLSVWSRVLTNPLVYVPVWNRSWRQGVPVAAWFALNPRLFPPPKDDSSWATKSVLGERIWTAELVSKGLFRNNPPLLVTGLSSVFFALAVRAAYRRDMRALGWFGGLAFAMKMLFLVRMAVFYEHRRSLVDS